MKKRNIFLTFLDGIYLKNPVLSLFLGLTLAVICTTSFQTALYVSAIVLVDMVIVELFVSIFHKQLGKALSYVLAAILSASIACIAFMVLSAYYPLVIIEGVGEYGNVIIASFIPFVATTSAVLVKGENASELDAGHAIADSLGSGIGFALALSIIGIIREILGTGELVFTYNEYIQFYVHIMDFTLPFVLQPIGGLLFAGLVCGFHASICRAFEGRKAKLVGGIE